MATWSLSPQYKKSAIEKMFFYKDGHCIVIEQGFRWATFTVESDERPLTDSELENVHGYELGCIDNDECWEMQDMTDGCWLDITADDDVPAEELEKFEAAWEEDSYSGVEELGWSNDDTEYYYTGPLELVNTDTGQVFQGEPDENVSVSGVPHVTNTDNPVDFPKEDTLDWEPEEETPLLTDWYPVSTNPVRKGIYQVLHDEYEEKWPFPSNVSASVWDGKKWDDTKVFKWRGLSEDPTE